MNWADFFNMGGYAPHVWSSWGLSTFTLVVIILFSKHRNAKIKRDIARQIQREERLDDHQ